VVRYTLWYGAKVKLHHTTGKPDWASVTPNSRNVWQRLAAVSHSVFTPGNVLSLIGLVLVGAGVIELLARQFGWAAFWIALGRLFDVADGMAADATGTKSPLGEAVDAAFDKITTLAVLIGIAVEHLIPLGVIVVIALHHVINVIVGYLGWRRHAEIRPTQAGKLSTALEWMALCSFMITAFSSSGWLWLAYVLLIPALVLGVIASSSYSRTLFTAVSAASAADAKARRT
jgi:phosphatidylglycerophosphate synthase